MHPQRVVPLEGDLLALVREVLPDAPAVLDRDSLLVDVGFDSIAFAELAAAVEERFGMDVGDAPSTNVSTVGDLVRLLQVVSRSGPHPAGGEWRGRGSLQPVGAAVVGPLLRWWFDLEIEHADRMPRSGPVVFCMNHESLLDIPVAVCGSPRPITFMAKRELFRNAAAGRFFHVLGGFSVDRDVFDLRAMEIGLEVLERGEVLGMYPEGTRRPGELLPFLLGAAWLALRTGATLQPAAIRGTERAMPPGRKLPKRIPIRLAFGQPIPVERVDDAVKRRAQAELLTSEVREVVRELLAG